MPISIVIENTGSTAIPSSTPGGFRMEIDENGNSSYIHESIVYDKSNISGNVVATTELPAAQLLTGSTASRRESLQLETVYQTPNSIIPQILPTNVFVFLCLDDPGLTPNDPILDVISIFS